ncbi:tektin-3-like [Amyelois transitella]|uniref:tektin-3-like n=1 Tax=Amyelois transitella TaxID=680683 RepID=UPI00299067D6|nr:tektin-3-like [Amyelois transitella]
MTSAEKGEQLSFGDRNYGLSTMQKWHEHNQRVLKGDIIGITDDNTSITKNCIVKVNQTSCDDYSDTTDQLNHRARHINYWKDELERAIKDIDAEIDVLEALRQQVKNAMDTLKIPEYITEECLDMRRNRMQSDLIYDEPQEELFTESALIENIKKLHNEMLRDIENQMKMNVAAKTALESDWSNKYLAFKYETANVELKTKSEQVKDIAGATRLSEGQSDVPSWEQYTVNALLQFKSAIDKSKALRSKVEAILINSARDLRSQDVKVNEALTKRIARTEQVKTDLENQLRLTLNKIVETENLLETLHDEMMKVSQRIQVAQTRLNTKNIRPNVENCREGSLIGLLDEVRDLNDSMSLLQKRSLETEKLRADLIHERSLLENEIMVKKKTIYLDNERCLFLRSHFQSAEKLCGF